MTFPGQPSGVLSIGRQQIPPPPTVTLSGLRSGLARCSWRRLLLDLLPLLLSSVLLLLADLVAAAVNGFLLLVHGHTTPGCATLVLMVAPCVVFCFSGALKRMRGHRRGYLATGKGLAAEACKHLPFAQPVV